MSSEQVASPCATLRHELKVKGAEEMTDEEKGNQSSNHDKRESGRPGGGQGRRDEVGRSGVYPVSGPHPPGPAEIRTEPAWGQGERGAAGYEDHGGSELSKMGDTVVGGYNVGPGGEPLPRMSQVSPLPREEGTREIPRDDWINFLDSFSRQHEGWLVTIDQEKPERRSTEAENRPLTGISTDHLDSRDQVYVSVDKQASEHLTHTITQPRRIRLIVTQSGAHETLEIESASGSRMLVRFRSPARPETLDGIAA